MTLAGIQQGLHLHCEINIFIILQRAMHIIIVAHAINAPTKDTKNIKIHLKYRFSSFEYQFLIVIVGLLTHLRKMALLMSLFYHPAGNNNTKLYFSEAINMWHVPLQNFE